MQKPLTKLLAGFLASLMLAGAIQILPAFAAEGEDGASDTEEGGTAQTPATDIPFHDDFAAGDAGDPYLEYLERHKNVEKAKESLFIDAANYDKANTTAAVEVLENFEGEASALYMPSTGVTSWKVNVPSDAFYAMRITYYPIAEYGGQEVTTYTTIERMLFIDGRVPFTEARYFYFPRNWKYEEHGVDDNGYCQFQTDASGNDVRPIRSEAPEWQTYYLRDWLGYTIDPFQFYFSAGEHTVSFEAAREPIVISKIELYRFDEEPSYEDFLAQKKAEGVPVIDKLGDGIIRIQAENPRLVSNANLYPINDRTSALTQPQDPQRIRFNIVNSTTVNQWMQYVVTVPEDGLYTIAIRFRQNDLIGMFTSRRILINGEIQFREASNIRFKYGSGWQSAAANNGKQSFTFYLKKGENTVTFETVLGDMTDYVYRVEHLIDDLNAAYKQMLQLTGPTPDAYRDYGFNRLVPGAVQTIRDAATELYTIADELEEITGELGDQVATLNTIAILFERMGGDELQIAPNFVTFKNYIIALSNWLYASLNQPLKMDYFTIQGENDPLPKAKAGFFKAIGFELKAFVGSFYMDYTTVDFKSDVEFSKDKTIEMWITSALGRDDALIRRSLVDNYFTPQSGITVTMKVITTGLTEAILAGMGPDIASMSSVDTITWGLRNAVEPLDGMEGFDEVASWMDEATLIPLQMTNAKGETHTYGMPQTLSFYMMFYRSDVLSQLGVEPPKTWEDLYDILPALLTSDLEVGMPGTLSTTAVAAGGVHTTTVDVDGLEGLKIFLYQMGGKLYNDAGYSIALDENVALDAFQSYCEMFSKYKCSIRYDLTRFRTGEIPIYLGYAVTTYNTLMSYYDIRGLWEMAPLPGVEQEDGTIDCTSPVSVTAYVIPRGAENPDATWEYMRWALSPETQRRLGRENLAVNANPTTKYNSPTLEAFLSQAWTQEEYEAISTQMKYLAGIPEYPGNYIVRTYVNSAFLQANSRSSDASEELLDRIIYINKEISRKRADFKMDYYDVSTGEYVPGRYISEPLAPRK